MVEAKKKTGKEMKEGEYIAQLKDIGFSDVRTIYREQMEAIVEARK